MELRPDQIPGHLDKDALAPVYLLAGNEPLLAHEAADAVRGAARGAGYAEREVLHVEVGFDWDRLAFAGDSLSLFAQQRLIELYLPDKGPGKDGSAALSAYAKRPPDDTILLVLASPLDAKQRHNAWYKALAKVGVASFAWPLDAQRLPGWIEQRAGVRGVRLASDAVTVLAAQTEGNLLACAQEIDRLALLYGDETVDAETMRRVTADSARFDIFDLPAKALAGDAAGVLRSLDRLREEGVDPVPILWALVRELRTLYQAGKAQQRGELDRFLNNLRMPPARKRQLGAAAHRVKAGRLLRLLDTAAHIDQANKGAARGRPWEELVTLALGLAGAHVPISSVLSKS